MEYYAILSNKDPILCQSLPNAYCVYSIYYTCLHSIIKILLNCYTYPVFSLLDHTWLKKDIFYLFFFFNQP